MKTPITYYGGKQSMLKYILPLIPPHTIYVEPFFGGGALFWAKDPAEVEVINDTNNEVVNFYQVLRKNFAPLQKEIRATLHSRELHRQASIVYAYPDLFTTVKRAWAFWVLASQSYASILDDGWGYGRDNSRERRTESKRRNFVSSYALRLEKVQIECNEAIRVIKSRDTKDTFFYCDPPYFNADMGHYKGYTREAFKELLETLAQIKGKFLLSSYPSELLSEYQKRHGWKSIAVTKRIRVAAHSSKYKTEVLTANYLIGDEKTP